MLLKQANILLVKGLHKYTGEIGISTTEVQSGREETVEGGGDEEMVTEDSSTNEGILLMHICEIKINILLKLPNIISVKHLHKCTLVKLESGATSTDPNASSSSKGPEDSSKLCAHF